MYFFQIKFLMKKANSFNENIEKDLIQLMQHKVFQNYKRR